MSDVYERVSLSRVVSPGEILGIGKEAAFENMKTFSIVVWKETFSIMGCSGCFKQIYVCFLPLLILVAVAVGYCFILYSRPYTNYILLPAHSEGGGSGDQ